MFAFFTRKTNAKQPCYEANSHLIVNLQRSDTVLQRVIQPLKALQVRGRSLELKPVIISSLSVCLDTDNMLHAFI